MKLKADYKNSYPCQKYGSNYLNKYWHCKCTYPSGTTVYFFCLSITSRLTFARSIDYDIYTLLSLAWKDLSNRWPISWFSGDTFWRLQTKASSVGNWHLPWIQCNGLDTWLLVMVLVFSQLINISYKKSQHKLSESSFCQIISVENYWYCDVWFGNME